MVDCFNEFTWPSSPDFFYFIFNSLNRCHFIPKKEQKSNRKISENLNPLHKTIKFYRQIELCCYPFIWKCNNLWPWSITLGFWITHTLFCNSSYLGKLLTASVDVEYLKKKTFRTIRWIVWNESQNYLFDLKRMFQETAEFRNNYVKTSEATTWHTRYSSCGNTFSPSNSCESICSECYDSPSSKIPRVTSISRVLRFMGFGWVSSVEQTNVFLFWIRP